KLDSPTTVASGCRTVLSDRLGKHMLRIRGKSLCRRLGQFCPGSDTHSTQQIRLAQVSGRNLACRSSSGSISADLGQKIVLAQKLPERPAVLPNCGCGTSDVPTVGT